ncbi:MobV family relaxase [Clostridium botulinum]|uniref:MobV family relaxase n=1 Tax=Clostridium botulinum TaxID=1491 RepID=UPI003EF210C6
MITGQIYAIFRVGEKKYKSIRQIQGYEGHMERKFNTPNADTSIQNERLIGGENIVLDTREYIEGIRLRKNAVLARDLLLTASPAFFINLSEEEKRHWVQLNIDFLKKHFGDNCLYATLHKDESTWHISAFIVPKFWEEKKKGYVLANSRYFDGKKKLSEWQDKYSKFMQEGFKQLKRGIKYSKARHIEIKKYYTLINSKTNEQKWDSVLSKAKDSVVLKHQVNSLTDTLASYDKYNKKKDKENVELNYLNLELLGKIEGIKQNKDIYKETIKAMSELYGISQESIIGIVNSVQKNLEKGGDDDKERRV